MTAFSVTYRFEFFELLAGEYALQAFRGIGEKCSPDCGSAASGGGTHKEHCLRRPVLIETLQHPKAVDVAAPMFWYTWELRSRYGVPEELTRAKWEEFMKTRSAS